MFLPRHLAASLVALAFAACSTPNPIHDAATDAAPADVIDVVDSGPPPPPPMLTGPCMMDSDCPSGQTCLLNTNGWPGGFCSASCTRDSDCPFSGVSYVAAVCRPVPGSTDTTTHCLRQCLNGFDCGRAGYTCVKASDTATSGVCVPSCTTDSCGTGARCNEWTGQCEATSVTYPPAGADNGQQCMHSGAMSECRSAQCAAQVNSSGVQSGWNGGYCVSSCALSAGWNSTSFFSGDTLPQSNCPSGSVCFPSTNDEAEQGPGQCFRGCMMDSDCRAAEGYFCKRSFEVARIDAASHTVHFVQTPPFTNGVCLPVDCVNDTSHPCPTGFTCSMRTDANGSPYGRCIPM
jgi:hypothetical protein